MLYVALAAATVQTSGLAPGAPAEADAACAADAKGADDVADALPFVAGKLAPAVANPAAGSTDASARIVASVVGTVVLMSTEF